MVPIIIAVVCFVAGVSAATRWLPSLAEGPVGGMAFFVVCGLIGAGLALVGVNVYAIVKSLEGFGLEGKLGSTILASSLAALLRDGGTLFGLAGIVYLLAPSPGRQPVADPAPGTSVAEH